MPWILIAIWRDMTKIFICRLLSYVYILTHVVNCAFAQYCDRYLDDSVEDNPVVKLALRNPSCNDSFVPIGHNLKGSVFFHDNCGSLKGVFAVRDLQTSSVIVTTDGFKHLAYPLCFPRSIVEANGSISALALGRANLLLLIEHTVYLYDWYSFRIAVSSGITQESYIEQLYSQTCCSEHLTWCDGSSDVVLAYRVSFTSHFYYSIDGGIKFYRQEFYNSSQSQFVILSSTVYLVDMTVAFLVREHSIQQVNLLLVTIRGETKGFQTLLNPSFPNHQLGMVQLHSHTFSTLFWDKNKMLYRQNLLNQMEKVRVLRPDQDGLLCDDEGFQYIESNKHGEFVIVTSSNRVLYGQEGYEPQAIFITDLLPPLSPHWAVTFGVNYGHFRLLEFFTDSLIKDSVAVRHYEYNILEMLAKVKHLLPQCQYENVVFDSTNHLYGLDITDSFQISTTIYTNVWAEIGILVEMAPSNRLTMIDSRNIVTAEKNEYEESSLMESFMILGVNLRQSLPHVASPGDQDMKRNSSVTHLRTIITSNSLSCEHNSQYFTYVTLNCPKNKNIAVKRANRDCESLKHRHSYTIDPADYDPNFGIFGDTEADVGKLVTYNYNLYGCPRMVYYNEPFTFDIHLYESDKLIRPYYGEYVVYEVNGVNKFSYKLKVRDVGCHHPPQSWKEMRLMALQQNTTQDIWTRNNYRSCFDNSSHFDELNEQRLYTSQENDSYEVLGKDNGNYITFSRNGIFIFNIIALDKSFSFCDLSTHVAVEVYGVQPNVNISPFIILTATLMFWFLLVMIAFCVSEYHTLKVTSAINEMEEIESFEINIQLYKNKMALDGISHRSGSPSQHSKLLTSLVSVFTTRKMSAEKYALNELKP